MRLSSKQKQFVLDCIINGEQIGKMSAEKSRLKMRNARDAEGNKMFTPDEYLKKDQLPSQFSWLSAMQSKEMLDISHGITADDPDTFSDEDPSMDNDELAPGDLVDIQVKIYR